MRKILIIIGIILLIIAAIVIYIVLDVTRKDQKSILTEREEQQAVVKILGRTPVEKPRVITGKTYSGKAVSFVYPSNANLVADKASDPFFDQVTWHTVTPYLLAAITTRDVSNLAGLTEDPSVQIRQQDSRYVQRSISWQNYEGLEFTKSKDGFEQSAFFFINRKEYTFAVTGDVADAVTTAFQNLLTSAKIVH